MYQNIQQRTKIVYANESKLFKKMCSNLLIHGTMLMNRLILYLK